MARRVVRDEGFSLIEVMFASFVAFFVMTAILSVIIVSAQVNRVSRADTKATSLANLLIEQARSLPYAQVGVLNGDPPGLLPANESTTYAGTTFQIEREVTWVDDDANGTGGENARDFKQLSIRVRWGANGAGLRFVTFVRDRAQEAVPPSVAWIDPMPADVVIFNPAGSDQAVVWDSNGGPYAWTQPVELQASVLASGAAGIITRVEYWTETRLLPGGALVPPAGTMSYTTPVYEVDSRAVDASGVAYLPDGMHTIKCEAWTASGLRDFVSWSFIVDNFPPVWGGGSVALSEPGPSQNEGRYLSRLNMSWTPPSDGGIGVSDYTLRIARNGGGWYASYPFSGSSPFPLATGAPSGYTAEPFSAYRAYLTARSPRGLAADSLASAWTLTNPQLEGEIRNNATKKNVPPQYVVTLTLSAPAPGALSAVGANAWKYDVYEATSWSSGSDLATKKSGFTDLTSGSSPVTITLNNPGAGKYYQVEAKLYNGTTQVGSIRSNVIGPSPAAPPVTTRTIPRP